MSMATDLAAGTATSHDGGKAGPSGLGGRPKRLNPKHLALIRIDFAALIRHSVGDGEHCDVPGVGPISVEQARRMLGDSLLRIVLTNGVDVVGMVRGGRGANLAQTLALLWTNPLCSGEGCNRPMAQIDHRTPWAQVHETATPNLDGYCHHDHDLKTRFGWELVEGTGKRPFVPPDDPRHPANTRRGGANAPPHDEA